uniref:Uncharacterized protein n=1 Tax=Oryza glumipatula TaxID=40148 RepID=A0A0E0BR87_9ORYZ
MPKLSQSRGSKSGGGWSPEPEGGQPPRRRLAPETPPLRGARPQTKNHPEAEDKSNSHAKIKGYMFQINMISRHGL